MDSKTNLPPLRAGDSLIRVLVVGDDPVEAAQLAKQLQAHGCDCSAAHGARDGLDALEFIRPEVVVLDLEMRGVDGIEFLRAARETGELEFGVIALSPGGQHWGDLAGRHGAFAVVRKPARADQLSVLIRNLLDYRRIRRNLQEGA